MEGKTLSLELDEVLFNFAATPDEKFQPALTRVLPRVLKTLAGCTDEVRDKTILVLNHVNKRLRVLPAVELPLFPLVSLFVDSDPSATLQVAFILMYIEKGFAQCNLPPRERLLIALSLLQHLPLRTPSQQTTLLHLVLSSLEDKLTYADSSSLVSKYPFLAGNSKERQLLARFLSDVILFVPGQNFSRKTAEQATPQSIGPPSGLSKAAVTSITKDGTLTSMLQRFKVPACTFLIDSGLFSDIEMLQAGLFAMCSGDPTTESRGDLLLRKGNSADLEDATNISILLRLFLGDDATVAADDRRSPASVLLKPRLGAIFCRSVAAANSMALTLKVLVELLFGADTSPKLQILGMQFLNWALRVGTSKTLAKLVPAYSKVLLKYLAGVKTDPLSVQARGMCFALVGHLGSLNPGLYNANLEMFDFFFTTLAQETDTGVAASVMEGIAFLRQAYRVAPPGVLDQLKNSLMVFVDHPNKNVRLMALQCNNALFPFHDSTARYFCLRLVSDPVSEVKEEARRGLTTTWYEMQRLKDEDTKMTTEIKTALKEEKGTSKVLYPAFPSFVEFLVVQLEKHASELHPSITSPRSLHVMEHLLPFLRETFNQSAGAANKSLAQYTKALLESEDQESQISIARFLEIIEYAFTLSTGILQPDAADALLELVQCHPSHFAPHFLPKISWLQDLLLNGQLATRDSIAKLLCVLSSHFSVETISALLNQLTAELQTKAHGAVLGIGVLVAECLFRKETAISQAFLEQSTVAVIEVFEKSLATRDFVLAAASILSLGRIGEAGCLPLPTEDSSGDVTMHVAEKPEEKKSRSYTRVALIDLLATVANSPERKEARISEQSIISLAKIAIGDRSESVVTKVIGALLALVNCNVEEMHFAVGQGFAAIFTGSPLSETWGDPVSDRRNPWENPAPDANAATIRQAEEKVLHSILRVHLVQGSKVQRMAACVWLLCLVKYAPPVVKDRIREVQAGFSKMLTDSNQFTQECASKGLSFLYEVGDPAMQDLLVKSLLQTFSVGSRTVREDTEVVIDSESGDFTTYKELCQVANELGQPDLVYKFLDLASHHSIWSSKAGAAFSLGSIAAANRQLAPQLNSLLPKLYRYQFDPNAKIKETMKTLWQTLVTDPAQTLSTHFRPIILDLIACLTGRLWRERHAAGLAIADLVHGCTFAQVGEFLEDIWIGAFRALDDVNEGVRTAATELCSALTKLVVRLANPVHSSVSDSDATLGIVLPILLNKGITNRAQEVSHKC